MELSLQFAVRQPQGAPTTRHSHFTSFLRLRGLCAGHGRGRRCDNSEYGHKRRHMLDTCAAPPPQVPPRGSKTTRPPRRKRCVRIWAPDCGFLISAAAARGARPRPPSLGRWNGRKSEHRADRDEVAKHKFCCLLLRPWTHELHSRTTKYTKFPQHS